MGIGKINFSLPTFNPKKDNNNKPLANLNEPIRDTFTFSKKKLSPIDIVANEVANMKDADGKPRFSEKEVNDFKVSCATNVLDFETVNTFKDNTNFNMKNMKAVYRMGKELKDDKFNEKVINAISKLPKAFKPESFIQSIFEPEKEFSLENDIGTKSYTFDAKTSDLIFKSTFKTVGRQDVTEEEDYRNNKTTTRITQYDYDIMKYRTLAQTVVTKDKAGKVIREEEMIPSEVEGIFDIKYTDANGRTKQISKGTIDKKTGIVSIKKDMKSSNGTRTQYLFEDDPQGNRIMDYKITDKNGKILMSKSQTFEVIEDNHFVSSNNGYKYDITTDDKKLTVKDLHHNRETSIDFENKLIGDKDVLIGLMKKVPGQELFEAVATVNKVQSTKDSYNSSFSPMFRNIKTENDLYSFLHELGHAKDVAAQKNVKCLLDVKKNMFTGNKDIQKTYLKERETFNKYHSDEERQYIQYFTQARGHYQGKFGGLSEIVAETNALVNSRIDEKSEVLGARFQYLQQHFPETIAKIQDAMNWKDDIDAIEYYGT